MNQCNNLNGFPELYAHNPMIYAHNIKIEETLLQ